jgi:predicted nucleotidyltransferase
LFGSVLTPRFGPKSDIDMLVDFQAGAVPGFSELAEIEEECSRLLGGRRVDLRPRGDIGRFLRASILRGAETIYGAVE